MTLAKAVSIRSDNATRFNCALIALMATLNFALGFLLAFRWNYKVLLEPEGGIILIIIAIFSTVCFIYTYLRRDVMIRDFSLYFILFFFSSTMLGPLSYFAAALNFPLQDTSLAAIDSALGLNWLDWLAFTIRNDWLREWSNFIYGLTTPLMFAVMLSLPVVCGIASLKRFVTAYSLCGFVVCVLSAPFVATGTYQYYGLDVQALNGFVPAVFQAGTFVDYMPTLHGLRDGTIRVISFVDGKGIVAFPSFHAVLSVLMILCYVGRSPLQKVLLALAIIINVAILITVPASGGHYFIDVIAGILIGVAGWVVSGYIAGKDGDGAPAADRSLPAGISEEAVPQS